jgi:hypothetical protein
MGIFDKVKKTTINSRRYEERLYEVALEEVENNEIRKGLYAKALSKADGDKKKADGIYLKLRVQSIMDDIESEEINSREDARAYAAIQELKEFESINILEENKALKKAERRKKNKKRIMFIFWFIFSSLALLIFTQIVFGSRVII